jgi:hypothetical protein
VTVAERWDGTSWTVQSTPNPGDGNGLSGVSCTSATSCTAVGGSVYSSRILTVGGPTAERWDGASWTVQNAGFYPGNVDGPAGPLSAVSCPSAKACIAVGWAFGSSGAHVGLAERWDGASWTAQIPPNPQGTTASGLSGVSCTSATACTAVGGYDSSTGTSLTLAERWNGTSWRIQTPVFGVINSGLAAVSCPTATTCVAVGNYTAMGQQRTLVERWTAAR